MSKEKIERGSFVKVIDDKHPNYKLNGAVIAVINDGDITKFLVEHFEKPREYWKGDSYSAYGFCTKIGYEYSEDELEISKPEISKVKAGDIIKFKNIKYSKTLGNVKMGGRNISTKINKLSGQSVMVNSVSKNSICWSVTLKGDAEHMSFPLTAFENKINNKKMSRYKIKLTKLNKTRKGALIEVSILETLQKCFNYFTVSKKKPINDSTIKSVTRYKITGDVASKIAKISYLLFSKELIDTGTTRILFSRAEDLRNFSRALEKDVSLLVATYLQRKKYYSKIE